MDKAVILARGLGTRMQKADDSAQLTDEQTAIAQTGVKAMIPIDRPFLDYVISALADAGYRRICLVVGPEHSDVRVHYKLLNCRRVNIEFAIQVKPLGTSDAVAAAEQFAADDDFLVINSDNYYPIKALQALRGLDGPGLAAFDRDMLIDGSNIPAERIVKFAIVQTDSNGCLTKIIEKPSASVIASISKPIYVSMNCWRLNSAIFTACRSISPSARGELELPDAVQYAIDHLGQRFRVARIRASVLDMSSRKDIKFITAALAGTEVLL
jgi:dTDP-glucose pyrophosphorylase